MEFLKAPRVVLDNGQWLISDCKHNTHVAITYILFYDGQVIQPLAFKSSLAVVYWGNKE